MFNLRRVIAFWAAMALMVGLATAAGAQTLTPTVTLSMTGVTHSRPNRGGNLLSSQINYDDCELGDVLSFPLSLANYTGYTLQAWAGDSCDQYANRETVGLTTCWPLITPIAPTSTAPNPILISVKSILYGRTLAGSSSVTTVSSTGGSSGTGGTGGSGGSVAGSGGAATATSEDPACTDASGSPTAQTITVTFLLVDAGNMNASAVSPSNQWTGSYKLSAPAPPDTVTAGIGEDLLPIHFTYTATSDTTINGYNFYCDPPPGVAAAADAGVLPLDGGIAITACSGIPSSVLVPGNHVDTLDAYRCGGAGKSANGGNATGLVDGVAYTVAVATTDSYNNVGVLSTTTCQVPQPVTGFYKAYRNAGGTAGGGFCSISRRREPITLLALLGVASYFVVRRRRAA
jgi:hypothetical protein